MDKTAEYYMISDLMEQVNFACVALEDLRGIAETPEELQKIDVVLSNNKKVIEKAREELKTVTL